MGERDIRNFVPSQSDLLAAELGFGNPDLSGEIPEEDIRVFCRACDHLDDNNICVIAGSNDQARYAAKKWCGWSKVNGVRGSMTAEGFIPGTEK